MAKRIIPCLDIDAGRVVKGVKFKNIRDAGAPAETAQRYDEDGADELVFLDITATSDGRDILLSAVREVAENVRIPLTVGGGVRNLDDLILNRYYAPAPTKSALIPPPLPRRHCWGNVLGALALNAWCWPLMRAANQTAGGRW